MEQVQSICASCQAEVITAVVRRSAVKDDSAAWSLSLITSFNVVPNYDFKYDVLFGVTCYEDRFLGYEGFSFPM